MSLWENAGSQISDTQTWQNIVKKPIQVCTANLGKKEITSSLKIFTHCCGCSNLLWKADTVRVTGFIKHFMHKQQLFWIREDSDVDKHIWYDHIITDNVYNILISSLSELNKKF